MLKLVFYTNDHRLKVRLALPEDDFSKSYKWKERLDFIVSDNGDFMMIWTSLLPDLDPKYAEALVDLVGSRYPVSANYKKLKIECPQIIYNNPGNEWVIFGGTFNPWHKGHQACLDLIPEDKVCLIMPDQSPHKDLREIHNVSTILEISNKARLKKLHFLVPTFLLEKKINPTIDWVEKMKEDLPSTKISLLMGFDSFAKLKTWTRSEDLLKKLDSVYVASRLENDQDRTLALDEAHAMNLALKVVFLGKHDYENISSTDLRNKMK